MMISEKLNEIYRTYVASQVGEARAKKASDFSRFGHLGEACGVAQKLQEDYDTGIALATDGLYLGYIAQQFGFPVLNVKMGRRLNGATWEPIDEISEKNIRDRKIIVFDNDVVTGRTLRRAVRELKELSPEYIDLLLVYGHTEVDPDKYHAWKKFLSDEHIVLGRDPWGDYILDTMCQIPDGFRRVISLEEDFEPDQKALTSLVQKLRVPDE